MEKLFVDLDTLPSGGYGTFQLLFLMLVYAFVLFKASNLISDGSELLLLIPSLAGIVGSVVLPVLGAVPDGTIVLFSGLGPKEEAEEQLSVGVGALAGSTIMLLTIPWALTLIVGRVNLDSKGNGAYNRKDKLTGETWNLFQTGTNVKPGLRMSAIIMIITAISYLFIQGPAFQFAVKDSSSDSSEKRHEADVEHWWALVGLISSLVLFVLYLIYQVITANKESNKDRIAQVQHDAISKSLMSVSAVFADQLFSDHMSEDERQKVLKDGTSVQFERILREFFNRHDLDGNGVVDATEMRGVLADLGECPSADEFNHLMQQMDSNHDGVVQFEEFRDAIRGYIRHIYDKDHGLAVSTTVVDEADDASDHQINTVKSETEIASSTGETSSSMKPVTSDGDEEEEDLDKPVNLEGGQAPLTPDEEDEEEEVPDDLAHLTPSQQRRRIVLRSFWMMGLGVALVILFSDPMVDCFSELGKRMGVPQFYIAFVLAPLASNASELIASINYARKKTIRAATIGCESLIGAACMNNTFCLSIFLILVFVRRFAWVYSAETLSILFVEAVMLIFAVRRTQRLFFFILTLLLYPISIALVYMLETYAKWN